MMISGKGKEEGTRKEEKDWGKIVAQYESSGLSHRGFCSKNGIKYSTFKNHLYQIRLDRQSLETPPLFSLVGVEEKACPPVYKGKDETPLIVEVQDVRIVIRSGFEAETLGRLLSVVRGCHDS